MSNLVGQHGPLFRLNTIRPLAAKCIQISMSVGKIPRNEDPVDRVLRLARTRPVVRARDVADQASSHVIRAMRHAPMIVLHC
jgi:hypothetical protein